MEIVIEIPESIKQTFDKITKDNIFGGYFYDCNSTIGLAIKNGIPLPKGHGRLKDVDAIMRELSVVSCRPVKSQMYIIEQAPTVVEADIQSEIQERNEKT